MPPAGRLGDNSKVSADAHGCPACPHTAIGPAITGSPTVNINGLPALRVDDLGIHAACCGPNLWRAITGSASVRVNGKPLHRQGDQDLHCGGIGQLVGGSSNVLAGGPSSAAALAELLGRLTALLLFFGKPRSAGDDAAAWADKAFADQDSRFFDSTTKGVIDWLKHPSGYAKCNQFVAAAYSEGTGMDYPSVDGRPPVVDELADPNRFTDKLSYKTDQSQIKRGDIALWYDKSKNVHHSAIVSGFDANGEPLVTYAGSGDKIKRRPLHEVTESFEVAPAFRGPK